MTIRHLEINPPSQPHNCVFQVLLLAERRLLLIIGFPGAARRLPDEAPQDQVPNEGVPSEHLGSGGRDLLGPPVSKARLL